MLGVWNLSGHMLGDRVKGKHVRGPLESRVAHLPLISSPKAQHQTQPLALNQGEAEQMIVLSAGISRYL